MVPNSTIVFLMMLLAMFRGAESLPQPSNSSDCKVPPDLTSCGEYLEGGSPKPSAVCCRNLTLAVQTSDPQCLCGALHGGGAPFAVNKDTALSLADDCKLKAHALLPCHDGSGTTDSPKDMRSSSNRSINIEDVCPGCETGGINDPEKLIPSPPQVLPP